MGKKVLFAYGNNSILLDIPTAASISEHTYRLLNKWQLPVFLYPSRRMYDVHFDLLFDHRSDRITRSSASLLSRTKSNSSGWKEWTGGRTSDQGTTRDQDTSRSMVEVRWGNRWDVWNTARSFAFVRNVKSIRNIRNDRAMKISSRMLFKMLCIPARITNCCFN